MHFGILVLVILAVLVSNQALSKIETETLHGFVTGCAKEIGVDLNLIQRLRKGEDVNDDSARNYMFCMYKKLGFLSDDGVFQLDTIKAVLSVALTEDEIDHLIKECAVQKATPQETAHDSYICYRKLKHDYLTAK